LLTFLLSLSATTPRRLFWLGTVLGLAVAIKWVALGVIVPVGFVLMRKEVNGVRFALMFIWAVFVYLAIILAGNLIGRVAHPFNYIWEWQYQAFFYHWDLTVGHPWGSRWYTWPFMIRPVLFAYDPDKAGQVSLISAIGNPLVWWSSTIAVLYSLREVLIERLVRGRRILDHPLVPLLLGYAAFLLPWVGISRVQFIYHYLCAYGFALLILTYWLSRVWRKRPWLVVGYLVLVVAVAVFFLPLQIYWPISLHWLHYHIWLKSWL
ncbi:hypothetical protein KGQ71_03350, partial [Patescibacteria group bacterium]|nr:hypothetical protein [Patescibacteria group bacterium]